MLSRDGDPMLYICYQEEHTVSFCYGIRAINLVDLLSCSCKFDEDSREIIQCNRCQSRLESGDSDRSGDLKLSTGSPIYAAVAGKFATTWVAVSWAPKSSSSAAWNRHPSIQRVHNESTCSKRVFVFETETAADHGSKSIQEMDESSNLTKFLHGKVDPWLVELNGDFYAFSLSSIPYPPIRRSEANPTILISEVYRRGSQKGETLPKPPQPQYFSDTGRTFFSCAITCGGKVLVSKWRPSEWIVNHNLRLSELKAGKSSRGKHLPNPCGR